VDETWAYVGLSTAGDEIAMAAARPTWTLTVTGRKPRGEWSAVLHWLERQERANLGDWLARQVSSSDGQSPIWGSRRLRMLVDVSEYGAGELLRHTLARAMDRYRFLGTRLRMTLVDVTERDVLPSGRADGALTLSRRLLVAPLLAALEDGRIKATRSALYAEFREQMDALRRRAALPGVEEAREDLVRAVALPTWALHQEGAGQLRGFTESAPLCVH